MLETSGPSAAGVGVEADKLSIRPARYHELEAVAQLQLDAFAPVPPPPTLLPMIALLFEANQRAMRDGMRQRLIIEIERRLARGSDILVAVAPESSDAAALGSIDTGGRYTEPTPLLGTVELSTHEIELPTHALSGGIYLSHLVVEESFRRRGLAQRLLREAEGVAATRHALGIYLHVERDNAAALSLYERGGYERQPESPRFVAFTRALALENRDPVLLYRNVSRMSSGES